MLRRGETVSPAAMAILFMIYQYRKYKQGKETATAHKKTYNSGEVINANPALTTACQYPKNLPVAPFASYSLNAPGCCQYLNPRRSWFGPPPKKSTTPRIMRPRMVITLILANQNSASPKKPTAMIFRRRMMRSTMVIQMATFTGRFPVNELVCVLDIEVRVEKCIRGLEHISFQTQLGSRFH